MSSSTPDTRARSEDGPSRQIQGPPSGAKVIYVSPNALGSPLVRSQVLPYLNGLVRRGNDVWLITFERGEPAPDHVWPTERWRPIRARPGHGLLAKTADVVAGVFLLLRLVIARRASLIHARSYLPAAIALIVGALTRRPYVFDMRGFLPDEYVEGGVWSVSDMRYRLARLVEGRLLASASEIVVLTNVAAERLRSEARFARRTASVPITVIPCAVDLAYFSPAETRPVPPMLVYSGSLGMWYRLDEMLRIFDFARRTIPELAFLIVTRSDHALVHEAVARLDIQASSVHIRAADFDEVPELLRRARVGIALLDRVSSKTGSSPIKIAEYLACGLPIIVNRGLGDIDELVARTRAGHVVEDYSLGQLQRAGEALVALVRDNEVGERARALAKERFDLRAAVDRYQSVYDRLATGRGAER